MRSPTPKYSYHKWRNDHGGALVEFAIVMPLLLLIVGGIIEFGVLFYNKQVITNASREGARAGIVNIKDTVTGEKVPVDIDAIVKNYCNDKLLSFGGTKIPVITAPDSASLQTMFYPSDLSVKVEFTHFFLFSSFLNQFGSNFGPTIKISATTVMRME